ncbi:MAG: hypothetical protein KAJ14_15575 [Candidatus Omnitrophica bacterium]|nr:hypothetical protein [Candidatus Omnitrophota bacterium]
MLKKLNENFKTLDDRKYSLTVTYIDNDNLDEKIEELLSGIKEKAEDIGCSIDGTFVYVADDENRRWE